MLKNTDNKRYTRIRPSRDVTGVDKLGSSIEFENVFSAYQRIDLQNSYLSMYVGITASTAFDFSGSSAPAAFNTDPASPLDGHDGLSQNPMSLFFNWASLELNNVEVSKCQTYPLESTVTKLLFKNNDELLNDNSPMTFYRYNSNRANYVTVNNLDNSEALYTTAGLGTIVNDKVKKTRERVLKCCPLLGKEATTGDDSVNVINAYFALPLAPLFMSMTGEELFGNLRLRLILNVNTNYAKAIPIHMPDPATDSYTFDVKNLFLNVLTYDVQSIPQSITFKDDFLQPFSYTTNFNSDTIQVNLPSSTNKVVAICFEHGDTNTDLKRDANYYEGPFTSGTAANDLLSLWISMSGHSYPTDHYVFTDGRDWGIAYENYKQFTGAQAQSLTNVMSYSEFLMNPVFVFHVESNSSNLGNTLIVNSTSGSGIKNAGYNIRIVAYYVKTLEIEYDQNGTASVMTYNKA